MFPERISGYYARYPVSSILEKVKGVGRNQEEMEFLQKNVKEHTFSSKEKDGESRRIFLVISHDTMS